MFYGRGAGSLPTGSAICADIMDAARAIKNEIQNCVIEANFAAKKVVPMEEQVSRFYLRLKAKNEPGVFAKLATAFGNERVSLDMIIQKRSDEQTAEIVLVTNDVSEGSFNQAMDKIREMPSIQSINSVLRVVE